MNCTLCQTSLIEKVDAFYYRCSTCNAYVKDQKFWINSIDEKQHYAQHQNDINDLGYQNFTAPVTQTILELCSPNQLGLDFGCGTGPVITEQLKKQGYRIDLYDPYFYPETNYLHRSYDFIFSCEVVEHFYHPKDEFIQLKEILKTGGLLIIKTHLYTHKIDFAHWYYRKDTTHVFIYTYKTFEYIAAYLGFDLVSLEEKLIVLKKK